MSFINPNTSPSLGICPILEPWSTRVVLINRAGGDLAFRVAVADTTQPPSFFIQQVAGPDDELRAELTDYDLAFVR